MISRILVNKTRNINMLPLLLGGILLVFLLLSILFYTLEPAKQLRRKFIFPREMSMKLTGETRNVSVSSNRESNIRAYLDDLLLGPATLRLVPIFPEGTRLNHLKLVNNDVYVDFSRNLVFNLENHSLKLVEIKNLLVDNLSVNFPFLEKIIITVNGLEPRFGIEE